MLKWIVLVVVLAYAIDRLLDWIDRRAKVNRLIRECGGTPHTPIWRAR